MLWIDASSEISAHQAIKSILSKAEIPVSAQGFERNLLAFKDALTLLEGPCLLVFDNYDTPRDFSKIADMFVQHEHICIMLTSRHHESLRLGMPIYVRDMDQSDAEDLFLISSNLIRQDVDPKHLTNIVNMLGCLPLALDQAGAYIRKLHLSLDLFEKHYIDKQKKILQYTPDLFEYRKSLLPGSEPSVLSVFTTWELSLEQLGDDRPHLEHLLTLSAFFDHNKVHEALFSTRCTLNFTACSGIQDAWLQCMLTDSAWDSYNFQDIIANLHGLSLLQKFWIEDGHIVFSLHPLVNDWLRTRVGEKDRASMIVEAAVTVAGMDGSLDLFSHLNKCFQALSDCAKPLFNDCVDMRPPRRPANSAPVAKFVADKLNPKPHYGRAEALYCPHGRPCHPLSSTTRLKWIVSGCIAGIALPKARKQYQDSARVSHIDKSINLRRRIITIFEKNEMTVQEVETLSEFTKKIIEADVMLKQGEEIGVDGSFHHSLESSSEMDLFSRLVLSTKLADWADISTLHTALTHPGNLDLTRDALRSLSFLESGF